MKNKIAVIVIVVLSIGGGVLGSLLFFQDDEIKVFSGTEPAQGKKGIEGVTDRVGDKAEKVPSADGKQSVRISEGGQVRSEIPAASTVELAEQDETVDEKELTPPQKAVLKELQAALDDNNIRRVRKALSKFAAKAEAGGLGGRVPVCMRKRAVSALGWFGKDAAVDLLEYVADANEDVANDAFTQFEQALSDCEMGDVARSKILTAAMKALNDGEQIDSLLNQLNDMRNSVKALTAGEILTTGTDAAKTMMQGQMDFYFDEGVTDVDGLARWQAMNPDEATDAETYGGSVDNVPVPSVGQPMKK